MPYRRPGACRACPAASAARRRPARASTISITWFWSAHAGRNEPAPCLSASSSRTGQSPARPSVRGLDRRESACLRNQTGVLEAKPAGQVRLDLPTGRARSALAVEQSCDPINDMTKPMSLGAEVEVSLRFVAVGDRDVRDLFGLGHPRQTVCKSRFSASANNERLWRRINPAAGNETAMSWALIKVYQSGKNMPHFRTFTILTRICGTRRRSFRAAAEATAARSDVSDASTRVRSRWRSPL